MMRSTRVASFASLALIAAACSPPPVVVPPDITVTTDVKQVVADGTNKVQVTVERPGSIDVALHAVKGTFADTGTANTTIKGGTGTIALVTCDSRTQAACAGTVAINASSSDDAVGSVSVTFMGIEMCSNGKDDDKDGKIDCADEDCAGATCTLPSGSVGTGKCDLGTASCICSGGSTENCLDGVDNNCDGKIDCADPLCDGQGCKAVGGGGGTCVASACSCPSGAEICGDGVDNDCDNKVDCLDPNCQPSATDGGSVCDAVGHKCSAPVGGVSSCSICSGNGGIPEATEGATGGTSMTCGDGKDNDCDSTQATLSFDCTDTDCVGKPCAANGFVCNGTSKTCVCSGNGGIVQAAETACADGFDNDCDGLADCADPDCAVDGGQVCGTFGKKCLSVGTCGCAGSTEDCATPGDDDCNGLVNCQETKCRPGSVGLGAVCDISGNTCSQIISGQSTCNVCSGNGGIVEANEGSTGGSSLTCGDGKDNDCDGTPTAPSTDCQDTDCLGKACSNNGGVCNAQKQCACPGGLGNEQGLCQDGLDNDCDGLKDCEDPDCRAHGTVPASACGTGNGNLCLSTTCTCSGNGGAAQPGKETTCNDGFDNDCDGKPDCLDTDCLPVGNNLGQICDLVGNTCTNKPTDGGVATCTVCSGNGGSSQVTEGSCFDGHDNDCDGVPDCQDPDCNARACDPNGKQCKLGGNPNCVCPGTEATAEVSCGDNLDNDCDGKIDCADPDCTAFVAVCGANGRKCNGSGACVCTGNGGTAEANEGATGGQATCGDGLDNDCDGYADCLDTDCRPAASGSFGRDCSRPLANPATSGMACDITGACVCPGGQTAETSCADSKDNDCDGLVDCNDPNCLGSACSATGMRCQTTSLVGCKCLSPDGGVAAASESACSNGLDDDCDGLSDCLDPDCGGKQCNPLSANFTCVTQTTTGCQDQSANYNLTLAIDKPRIPADGTNTATITATLTSKDGTNFPASGKSVTCTVTSGANTGSILVSPVTTSGTPISATAQFTFKAGTTSGTSQVTCSFNTGTNVISALVNVDQPRLGQIKFVSSQYGVMGVRYSGFQEINQLSFQLLDSNNQPYPAGLSVSFTHTSSGDSFIGSTPSCTTANPKVCSYTGTTDASGFVSLNLQSGTVAAVVAVQASATAGGAAQSGTASNIAIVGAKANGLHLTLDCSPKNVPAFFNNDCTNSYVNATITCQAKFADRFNNVLGVATTATFGTEAGAAGPPAQTPAYSPGATNLGQANGFVNVAGYPLPVDVTPFTGERNDTYSDVCGNKTHNPRDGLVTIIVQAVGEEGFVDGSNGCPANGVYDAPGSAGCAAGENYVDQGEPFVDANDNGVRDVSEYYNDLNLNGFYDGPNAKWDSTTTLWAETRVMYTGRVMKFSTSSPNLDHASRWFDPVAYPASTMPTPSPVATFSVKSAVPGPASSQTFGVLFADQNFNYPGTSSAYSLTSIDQGTGSVWNNPPTALDVMGLSFTQQFCSTPTGGTCGSICNANPCFNVSTVSNYSYGAYGVAVITGAQPSALSEVRATALLGGVPTNVSIFGVCQ